MSDINIPAGAPGSSCRQNAVGLRRISWAEEPWRSDGRAAHTPELRTRDAWNPITLHIRVHPVIGQDAPMSTRCAQGYVGLHRRGFGAEIEEPLDVLATLRGRAVTCRIAHETTASMEGSELDARGRLAWETAFIDGKFCVGKKEGL